MPDVRADFARPAWLAPEDFEWVSSPQAGVERLMLDRRGDEVAVATTLVRYSAGCSFPPHEHPLGEEYLVLEGEFADDHGRYPAGTYVRNPPGSRHAPYSDTGCTIWVKLRQFHPEDQRVVVTDEHPAWPVEGSAARELHRFDGEVVTSIAATAGSRVRYASGDAVQEVLV
ncbi:MAG: cupin domain-containing protein, partial [Pseudomonadota bacterium]